MDNSEAETLTHSSFLQRLLGAATFRINTYEEVEHDPSATGQAAGVVGLVAVAAAVGSLDTGIYGLAAGVIGAYLGWALWSGTCYLVGVQLFEGTADWGELLRTIGFAQAPGILLALRILPGAGLPLYLLVQAWMIGTVLVAIRQASRATSKQSDGLRAAMMGIGHSPLRPNMDCSRSDCSVLVGKPVLGPPRWTLIITTGNSVMTARPIASPFSAIPGPLDAVTAIAPAKAAPIAVPTPAISSSA